MLHRQPTPPRKKETPEPDSDRPPSLHQQEEPDRPSHRPTHPRLVLHQHPSKGTTQGKSATTTCRSHRSPLPYRRPSRQPPPMKRNQQKFISPHTTADNEYLHSLHRQTGHQRNPVARIKLTAATRVIIRDAAAGRPTPAGSCPSPIASFSEAPSAIAASATGIKPSTKAATATSSVTTSKIPPHSSSPTTRRNGTHRRFSTIEVTTSVEENGSGEEAIDVLEASIEYGPRKHADNPPPKTDGGAVGLNYLPIENAAGQETPEAPGLHRKATTALATLERILTRREDEQV
ncbi:hypothetical protein Dimus_005575 [Dionaea muscipula]